MIHQVETDHGLDILVEHDLFEKPRSTFPDHALASRFDRSAVLASDAMRTSPSGTGVRLPGRPQSTRRLGGSQVFADGKVTRYMAEPAIAGYLQSFWIAIVQA
jgi:hypothetical protein